MAVIARKGRKKNKVGKFVEVKHPPINRRVIEETSKEGILPYSLTKEILDTYLDFGYEVTRRKEVFKIPYVGTLKPRIPQLMNKEEKLKF